jgi:hypothetical protein
MMISVWPPVYMRSSSLQCTVDRRRLTKGLAAIRSYHLLQQAWWILIALARQRPERNSATQAAWAACSASSVATVSLPLAAECMQQLSERTHRVHVG